MSLFTFLKILLHFTKAYLIYEKRIWQGAKERKCNKMLVALEAKVPG